MNAQGMIGVGTKPYTPPKKVTIQRCTLDGARRNNISINACDGVVIENNVIRNAGVDTTIGPGFGIDIEGYGEGDIDFEVPVNVVIKNNTFRGNREHSMSNYNGYGVVIEGNFSDHTISYGFGTDTVIANNVIICTDAKVEAIRCEGVSNGLVGNNVTITGNVVKGFVKGIQASGKDVVVAGNTISDGRLGIQAYLAENVLVSGNAVHHCEVSAYRIGHSKNVSLVNNKAFAVNGYAIEVFQSPVKPSDPDEEPAITCNLVASNLISKCRGGIKVEDSDVSVMGNLIDLREYEGPLASLYDISFDKNSNVAIKGNRIVGAKKFAIYGEGRSGKRVLISDNDIAETKSITAVLIKEGVRPQVIGNNISFDRNSDGGIGIYLQATSNAVVARNSVYSNSGFSLTNAIRTNESNHSKVLQNVAVGGGLLLSQGDTTMGNTVV
ncbi:right-handed parallel beta-helix repeat-containing protein [Brevibacillus humidisoli]|uniref:right-handed parallel beta-helix repeat-containing protein n=1 Tax=Brevibacillus humidisoli TaxID=2895522 RepID=UPI001E41872A|nr:right-handed parallel beta-helix repeat-containing protein [Brevibacillus humidisoli]UFJ42039.1 right-handed parallel beta-helix repeat-containing protein [Brevibacillus humidisoli]